MSHVRILVADDDPETRELLKTVLEKSGYTVRVVRDGEEAFRVALEWPPDLLLTDIKMPRLDGWDLVKRLRSRVEFALMPVIFLTQLGSEADRIRGFKLGADDYIPKPFDLDEMVARVTRALERQDLMEKEILRGLVSRDAHRSESGDGEDYPPLQGRLADFGISALLGVFEQERTTGVLELEHPDGPQARLSIREGRVVRASLEEGGEESTGPEAVYGLLAWRAGTFRLRRKPVEDRNEMEMSSTHLLLEGARYLDETKR